MQGPGGGGGMRRDEEKCIKSLQPLSFSCFPAGGEGGGGTVRERCKNAPIGEEHFLLSILHLPSGLPPSMCIVHAHGSYSPSPCLHLSNSTSLYL
jgi:hypothetical protein